MGVSPNVAPPFLIESENPDRETLSAPKHDMYQDVDIQEYQNWIRSRDSQPIDLELEQINKENLEGNGSDEAYYDEPNLNIRDGNTDSEKEDDNDTLPSVSSLVKEAQHIRLTVKTFRNLPSSQKKGIYLLDFIN